MEQTHDAAIDLLCETNRRLLLAEGALQPGLLAAAGVLLNGAVPAVGTAAWMIRTGQAAAASWAEQARGREFEPAGAVVIDLRDRRPCAVCGHGRAAAGCPCGCHWRRPAVAGAR